jgi:hypothetical protein
MLTYPLQVLSVDAEAADRGSGPRESVSVFELAGLDQKGLLAEVLTLLATYGCEVGAWCDPEAVEVLIKLQVTCVSMCLPVVLFAGQVRDTLLGGPVHNCLYFQNHLCQGPYTPCRSNPQRSGHTPAMSPW